MPGGAAILFFWAKMDKKNKHVYSCSGGRRRKAEAQSADVRHDAPCCSASHPGPHLGTPQLPPRWTPLCSTPNCAQARCLAQPGRARQRRRGIVPSDTGKFSLPTPTCPAWPQRPPQEASSLCIHGRTLLSTTRRSPPGSSSATACTTSRVSRERPPSGSCPIVCAFSSLH